MHPERHRVAALALCLLAPLAVAPAQTPVGTAFTYQGQLKAAGAPLTGTADFQFWLWDALAGGMLIAGPVTVTNQTVTAGLFTVVMDFGASPFAGEARWLEIAVRSPAGGGAYTTLAPRQELTPAPHALYAAVAAGVPGGLTGPGITNCVPKYTGATTLADSCITEVAGNVGVGVANPAARLDVAGAIRATALEDADDPNVTLDLTRTPTSGFVRGQLGIRGAPYWGGGAPGWGPDLHVNTGTDAAAVWIGGTRMIEGVAGRLDFVGDSAGPLMGPDPYAGIAGMIVSAGQQPRGALLFFTQQGTLPESYVERMRIMPTGYVGIGTAAPAERLDVAGTVQMTGFKLPTGATAGHVLTADAAGVGTWQAPAGDIGGTGAAGRIAQFTAAKTIGNSVLTQDAQGRIGLNATSPGFRFQINGTSGAGLDAVMYLDAFWNPEIYLDAAGLDADGKIHFLSVGREWNIIYDGSEDKLVFSRVGDQGIGTVLSLTKSPTNQACAGIGVLAPTEALDVNGTARLRGIAATTGTANVIADANGKLWKTGSSRRYKTAIRDLPLQPDAVLDLRPVAFQWKTTGAADIGLIAEEVAATLPELVVYDDVGRPDAVKYDKVALYLVSVIEGQQQKIADLAAQNGALATRLARLEAALAELAEQAGGAR
ncbi:MAG: tail fiber domain-containing protein [Planctomycetota bacterium]